MREDRITPPDKIAVLGRSGGGSLPPIPDVPGFRPERCASYLAGTEGSPPRPQLLRAIEVMRATGIAPTPSRVPVALDVGCGPGREVLALCEAGFRVDAFDPYAEMLMRTRDLLASRGVHFERVRLALGTVEEHAGALEEHCYDIVHAGFVLPFVRRDAFERCWESLAASLRPGGVFAGQFFGPNDEFIRAAATGDMTAHSRADIDRMFDGWRLYEHEEVDRQGAIGRGSPKWWHVHHVVARKAT